VTKLTRKQARFVDEYLIDLNATQAAVRAGYSAHTAKSIGQENLTKPDIAAAIDARQSAVAQRNELSQDWIIGRLRDNVERSMQAEPVLDREGNETGEYQYAGAVANKALELLGKHIGMFVDRSEVEIRDLTPEQRETRVLELLRTAKQRKESA
jgi:phage terminase small subunit